MIFFQPFKGRNDLQIEKERKIQTVKQFDSQSDYLTNIKSQSYKHKDGQTEE